MRRGRREEAIEEVRGKRGINFPIMMYKSNVILKE